MYRISGQGHPRSRIQTPVLVEAWKLPCGVGKAEYQQGGDRGVETELCKGLRVHVEGGRVQLLLKERGDGAGGRARHRRQQKGVGGAQRCLDDAEGTACLRSSSTDLCSICVRVYSRECLVRSIFLIFSLYIDLASFPSYTAATL